VTVIDNIGMPISGMNLALGDPSMISSADGEVLVQLREKHHPTAGVRQGAPAPLRDRLPVDRVLLPRAGHHDAGAQLRADGAHRRPDRGPALANNAKDYEIAGRCATRSHVRGAVDVHLAQVVNQPEVRVNVDRAEASEQGLTQRDVANEALVSLSSSGQVAPNFWLDPKKGVQYLVAVQTPQYKVDSFDAVRQTPVHLPLVARRRCSGTSRRSTATHTP
jgi:hypothetical protein